MRSLVIFAISLIQPQCVLEPAPHAALPLVIQLAYDCLQQNVDTVSTYPGITGRMI